MRKFVLFAAALSLSGVAAAQFVNPSAPAATTTTHTSVKSVLENGKDDQRVVLEGFIVEHVKGDDYRFKDKTGTLTVDIDEDDFKGQKVTPDTRVRIEGEVDSELVGENKVDVERLTVNP
ncbi:MAG: NirD/YgiW/YdeI family stress tolerance protein [Duodenibacillus sp.]|nr:NirD/YgiW/YdeI family stress tolerance protein [Duodenibacillus sp.]